MPPLFQPQMEIVLASRSPQRLELLSRLIPRERIQVIPPRNPDEPGFDNLHTLDGIAQRLQLIARDKSEDVREQLGEGAATQCIIAADTIIVVGSEREGWHALGQPPESHWQRTTRQWFREYYAGKTHLAMTALHVIARDAARARVVTTQVTFRTNIDDLLEDYLATGEPQGKAGGYAIQGLGSIFVERLEGSLVNVIGLPLRELVEMLREIEVVSYTEK